LRAQRLVPTGADALTPRCCGVALGAHSQGIFRKGVPIKLVTAQREAALIFLQ
jgi:hypothetical protein